MKRRQFLTMSALASVATVAACSDSSGADGGGGAGRAQVRYGHWDNGSAQAKFAALFEEFMSEHEGIEILQEFADYSAFQERMTTQIAGGEVADIFWIASPQVLAYKQAGIYHDLADLPNFDFDSIDADILDRLKLDDQLLTLPCGMITPAFRWNQTFLDAVGGSVPEQWTWESTAELLRDYAANNSEGHKGIIYHAGHDLTLEAWLRQHGEDLWTEGGQLGASVECVSDYVDWWEKLRVDEVTVSIDEQGGINGAWNELGSKVLADIGSHNQILESAAVFPDYVLEQVPTPALADAEAGHRFTYFVRMAVYKDTESLDAAGQVLNWNLNDPGFITELGPVQGTPASSQQRDALADSDDPNIQQMNVVMDEVLTEEMRPRFETPPNASTWRNQYNEALEKVVLGQASITDAITQWHDQVSSSL